MFCGPDPGKGQKSDNGPVRGPEEMPWTGPGPDFGNYITGQSSVGLYQYLLCAYLQPYKLT